MFQIEKSLKADIYFDSSFHSLSSFRNFNIGNLQFARPKYEDTPRNSDFLAALREVLISTFQPSGLASTLGLGDVVINGSTVLDIGTRDGRNIEVFNRLGASAVYGIDPDTEALESAIKSGKLDRNRAIFGALSDLPTSFKGQFDIAFVGNFFVGFSGYDHVNPELTSRFFYELHSCLKTSGRLLMTYAEAKTLDACIPDIDKYFTFNYCKLLARGDWPHGYLVVGTPKIRLASSHFSLRDGDSIK